MIIKQEHVVLLERPEQQYSPIPMNTYSFTPPRTPPSRLDDTPTSSEHTQQDPPTPPSTLMTMPALEPGDGNSGDDDAEGVVSSAPSHTVGGDADGAGDSDIDGNVDVDDASANAGAEGSQSHSIDDENPTQMSQDGCGGGATPMLVLGDASVPSSLEIEGDDANAGGEKDEEEVCTVLIAVVAFRQIGSFLRQHACRHCSTLLRHLLLPLVVRLAAIVSNEQCTMPRSPLRMLVAVAIDSYRFINVERG